MCAFVHLQDEAAQLVSWLQSIMWLQTESATFTITNHTSTDTQPLRVQLTVLRALRMRPAQDRVRTLTVRLDKWLMCHDTVAALKQLPYWVGRLDLSTCVWPEDGANYGLLAQRIPTTCTEWVLGPGVGVEQVMAAVKASGRWDKGTLPKITVVSP